MHSKLGLTAVSMLFALATLVACGGGGGGSEGGGNGNTGGGGGGGGRPPTPTLSGANRVAAFAYVTNPDANSVSAYAINGSTGALTEVEGSPFATGIGPIAVAVDRAGKFAYVANGRSGNFSDTVSAYSINATTGALKLVNTAPAGRSSLQSITVDPSGKFVYTTSGGSKVSSFEIDAFTVDAATGALTPMPGSFLAGTNPNCIAVHPSSKFAYVSNQASQDISSFTIGTTGALTSTGRTFAGIPVFGITVDPSGRFAYAPSGGILEYTIDATTGALTAMAVGVPAETGNGFVSIAIEPAGAFAYAAGINGVTAYAIDGTTGALNQVASQLGSGAGPITVDPSGTFVYMIDSAGIHGYTIGEDGALTEIEGSPLATVGGSSITTSAIQ
ncbi:MAG TPA: beta-propeller fold lactonase family protein [Pyrinomonadaceae bacterium]|nr:beta-propeller fold lactonase family protein [Pyrinomonadaceae bacterium]